MQPLRLAVAIAFSLAVLILIATELRAGEEAPVTISILAAGDIIMHRPLVEAAYRQDTQDYDFSPVFAEIAPLVQKADIAIANLETTFANDTKYTDYPRFNAPSQLAVTLRQVGFDLLAAANNHSLDYGAEGLIRTAQTLAQQQLTPLGIYASTARRTLTVVEKKGFKLGFLNYTCLTNGNSLLKEQTALLDLYSPKQLKDDVSQLKAQQVDAIICYLHFGQEYQRYPDKKQKKIIASMQQQGVDIIFGSHPHLLQPAQHGPEAHQYVLYSLGNFISCQRSQLTDVGAMVEIHLEKTPHGDVRISEVRYVPTYVSLKWSRGKHLYKICLAKAMDQYLTKKYAEKLVYENKSLYADTLMHLKRGLELQAKEKGASTAVKVK
ncbi:MAG: hypothetical protein C0621_10070 [Desulfuromonas sp.]|nr:MAG: hypothetical protein C0621_10070 [Desulfuromonas sp.]